MTERTGCEARQYSDQMHCGHCGLQWDMNDLDPPECHLVISPPQQEQNGPKSGREILDELGL